jgi:hypothetical protein
MSGVEIMSTTPVAPVRRVRHQAQEAAKVMAFSALTSVSLATAFVLLAHLGR